MRMVLVVMLAGMLGATGEESRVERFPRAWFWGFPQDLEVFERMVGKPGPVLALEGWIGDVKGVEALKGKVVVLDFFATWCPPCVEGVPKMNAFYEQWRGKGVEVVGVCTSEVGQEKLAEFVEKHGVKYPVACDPDTKTMRAWNVKTFPTYAVVDRKGMVRAVGLKQAFLGKAVERVLAEEAGQ